MVYDFFHYSAYSLQFYIFFLSFVPKMIFIIKFDKIYQILIWKWCEAIYKHNYYKILNSLVIYILISVIGTTA